MTRVGTNVAFTWPQCNCQPTNNTTHKQLMSTTWPWRCTNWLCENKNIVNPVYEDSKGFLDVHRLHKRPLKPLASRSPVDTQCRVARSLRYRCLASIRFKQSVKFSIPSTTLLWGSAPSFLARRSHFAKSMRRISTHFWCVGVTCRTDIHQHQYRHHQRIRCKLQRKAM